MYGEIRRRARKAGQPPGTLIYTGSKKNVPCNITIAEFSAKEFHEIKNAVWDDYVAAPKKEGVLWVHVVGLADTLLIEKIANEFKLHPLTVEDILNIEQRPKVEDFEGYMFITLKMLLWKADRKTYSTEQLSIVLGKHFVVTFQEKNTGLFDSLRERLSSSTHQRLRQQGADYLVYRILDTVVDQYFVVLEGIGDKIEDVDEAILIHPTPQNARTIYRLKRQMITIRKVTWPMREVISHLLQSDHVFSDFTRIYLRDVYDHTVQAIDNIETFRDMLSGMLDVYLSSITNRMNEIMKVLTMIATIFIPMTFVASIYGMNFKYMPELEWRYGYFLALGIMLMISVVMITYFRRKRWF